MEHPILIPALALAFAVMTQIVIASYIYGKLTQRVTNMETNSIKEAESLKKASEVTAATVEWKAEGKLQALKDETLKSLADLNVLIDGIKADCLRLRDGCQTETCARMDKIGTAITEGFKEVRSEMKSGAEKFERIALFMGRVDQYMLDHNGKPKEKEANK